MRPFFVILLASFATANNAQSLLPMTMGDSDRSVNERVVCHDVLWRINEMDEGTRVDIVKGELAMMIESSKGAVIITSLCGCDPINEICDVRTNTFVGATLPVMIFEGAQVRFKCERGAFVHMERLKE